MVLSNQVQIHHRHLGRIGEIEIFVFVFIIDLLLLLAESTSVSRYPRRQLPKHFLGHLLLASSRLSPVEIRGLSFLLLVLPLAIGARLDLDRLGFITQVDTWRCDHLELGAFLKRRSELCEDRWG